jgi:hypothetical protein
LKHHPLFLLVSALVSLAALIPAATLHAVEQSVYSYSFETDLAGWEPDATDLEIGDDLIDWSVTRSQEDRTDGLTGVKFYLKNINGTGKIWLERPFSVASNTRYSVTVEFDFTMICGINSLGFILAGVALTSPEVGQDIPPFFRESVLHRKECTSDNRWQRKSYTSVIETTQQGRFYAVVGVWGTWENPMSYYADAFRITVIPTPEEVYLPVALR